MNPEGLDHEPLFLALAWFNGMTATLMVERLSRRFVAHRETLMAGVDVLLVARMAGTSVAMIERVYGHFRNQSYQEAQARLDRERAMRGLRPRLLRANELTFCIGVCSFARYFHQGRSVTQPHHQRSVVNRGTGRHRRRA